jgi:hypothetical protein
VFVALDLSARDALSAGLAVSYLFAVQRLCKRDRKLILAHAARPGHQQRLADSALRYRALEERFYPIVTNEG